MTDSSKCWLLRFYPGASPGKEGNKLKIMMKNRKRNRSITNIVPTGNVPQNANGKHSDLG
jgi:hypothetical protein